MSHSPQQLAKMAHRVAQMSIVDRTRFYTAVALRTSLPMHVVMARATHMSVMGRHYAR